ncbi:MAG: DUF4147 domain-containing protein [Kofleriaceae bacterium]
MVARGSSGKVDRAGLIEVWDAALAAVAPAPLVAEALAALPASLARRPRRVLAVGKAAASMLAGAARAGGWTDAVVVAPSALPTADAALAGWPTPRWLFGAHPVPDARSVVAADALRSFVVASPPRALLVALVSGGASAMVAKPIEGLTLEEKIAAMSRLMASGAPIAELNAARRARSAVKGGALIADAAGPVLSLIASDVAGDDPRVVGSGLTVSALARPLQASTNGADSSDGSDGTDGSDSSDDTRAVAAAALGGVREEDRWAVIARQDAVATAAARVLTARGVAVVRRRAPLVTDVEAVAAALVADVASLAARPPWALVAFGEPVVRLPSQPGVGGRAQQLALLLARHLDGTPITALVAGTDGVDGPSSPPVAGAIVDGDTWRKLTAAGIDGEAALARCDARAALDAAGALLRTGPTGCNHADVMILTCG